jgi:hypothetical protein
VSYCLQRPAEPFGKAATHNPGFIDVGEEIEFFSIGILCQRQDRCENWAKRCILDVTAQGQAALLQNWLPL